MRNLIQNGLEDPEKALDTVQTSRYLETIGKTNSFIKMMVQYHPLCALRFVMEPNHLDRKFERSFTMAIKQNKTSTVQLFPKNSVKTCFVSLNQFDDFKSFAEQKRSKKVEELITTPLHLACQMSNMEAARILLTDHNYDVNILLHEKNFIYDLLNTASWEDFNILSNVFRKRQPCVNSG